MFSKAATQQPEAAEALSEAAPATHAPVARRKNLKSQSALPVTQPAIEIIWKASDPTIEKYIINYGYGETILNNKIELEPENIDQYEDPQYGAVYRYLLLGSDSSRDLFFNIQATKSGILSEPSAVMRVAVDSTSSASN